MAVLENIINDQRVATNAILSLLRCDWFLSVKFYIYSISSIKSYI